MKTTPSLLTPFVRSDAVGSILAEAFLHPDSELTMAEIARQSNTLPAVAHKEITRLVQAGVLTDRRQGNNRLICVAQAHPLYLPMSEIIAATYGPVPVLRDLLARIPEVMGALIYGSWAARRLGQPGAFPRDIDVLVIGNISVDCLLAVQSSACDRLNMEVNIHRSSVQNWQRRSANPFLLEVSSRPLVWLCGKEAVLELGTK